MAGWASGRFGLFGLTVQHVSKPGLNSAGVCVAILALVMFMFVKPEENQNASASKRKVPLCVRWCVSYLSMRGVLVLIAERTVTWRHLRFAFRRFRAAVVWVFVLPVMTCV